MGKLFLMTLSTMKYHEEWVRNNGLPMNDPNAMISLVALIGQGTLREGKMCRTSKTEMRGPGIQQSSPSISTGDVTQ
jgi:hypothetical protein